MKAAETIRRWIGAGGPNGHSRGVALADTSLGQSVTGETPPAVKETKPSTEPIGVVGTSFFTGMLRDQQEYNAKLQPPGAFLTYERMRRSDADIAAALLACKLPIRAADYQVVPGIEENEPGFALADEIADLVRDNLLGGMEYESPEGLKTSQSMESVIDNSMLSLDFGVAAHEAIYRVDSDAVRVARLAPRMPYTFFRFWPGKDGETLTALEQQGYRGGEWVDVKVPIQNLSLFTYQKEGANYWGRSILRTAYKHWYMKEQLERIDALAAEKNGLGVPDIEMGPNFTKEDRADAVAWVQKLAAHELTGIVKPPGWKFALQGVTGQTHNTLESIRYHSEMISRSVLAMFLTLGTTQSGARALGEIQTDFFKLSLESLAWMIADTLNTTVVRRLVDYNFPGAKVAGKVPYPTFQFSKILAADINKVMEVISKLAQNNVSVIRYDPELEDWAREQLSLPKANPQPAPAPQGPQNPQAGGTGDGQEAETPQEEAEDEELVHASEARTPVPGEQHYDWAAHEKKIEAAAGRVASILRQERPRRLREWVRAVLATGAPANYPQATLPLDRQLEGRLNTALAPARRFGHEEVLRNFKRATGKNAQIGQVRMADDSKDKKGLPVNPDPMPVGSRPVIADGALVAQATLVDYDNWLRTTATGAAIVAARQGRVPAVPGTTAPGAGAAPGRTLDQVVDDITKAGLQASDANIERFAERAAIMSIVRENLRTLAAMGKDVKRIFRTEVLDRNTCPVCFAGNGQSWKTVDEINWFPGDDCEGGLNCRGGYTADWVGDTEGQVTEQ